MLCSRCGHGFKEVIRERTVEFRGRSVVVPARYLQCEGCGEILVDPEDSTDANRRAADLVRQVEGLLSSAEIRAIREQYRLKQREFEQLLRVGKNTVVRWESGTVIQSAAVDNIMRSLAELPELAENMAVRNGVSGVEVPSFTLKVNGPLTLIVSQPSTVTTSIAKRRAVGEKVVRNGLASVDPKKRIA